jgi:peroxiredoxin Q/BCP
MSAFRDSHAEFAGADAQVLGISMDDLETQTRFSESLKTPFPLLADPDGKTAQAYGVIGGAGPVKYASRVTFVIGKDGKVTDVFEGKDALDPAGALSACKRPK